MAVKTSKNQGLEYQLSRLVERFDHFTTRDSERWDLLNSLLPSKEEVAAETPSTQEIDDESSRFLKANDLFGGLPNEELTAFLGHGDLKVFEPGEWIFKHGEACSQVVAIRKGILEIRRDGEGDSGCVALLGTGEILGMLGVLTGGMHRSSARFPEGGEGFVIDGASFDAAIESLPKLSAALTRSLARRLIGAVQKGDMSRAKRRQLEGSLAHFDLSTVLQSLFATDACAGSLHIFNESGDELGEIIVGNGRILGCCCGKLVEREAFQQLFLADNSENRFSFEESDTNSPERNLSGGLAALSGAGLLMDCARIADELARIRSGPLGDPEHVLERLQAPADWDEPATRCLVREIWRFLAKSPTVADVLVQEFDQEYVVYRLLHRLLNGNYIR